MSFAVRACAITVLAVFAATAAPSSAANKQLTEALKTAKAIGADPKKLDDYCAMNALFAKAQAETEFAKADALQGEATAHLKKLGAAFESLSMFQEETDPESADGKALAGAMAAIDAKCPKP